MLNYFKNLTDIFQKIQKLKIRYFYLHYSNFPQKSSSFHEVMTYIMNKSRKKHFLLVMKLRENIKDENIAHIEERARHTEFQSEFLLNFINMVTSYDLCGLKIL